MRRLLPTTIAIVALGVPFFALAAGTIQVGGDCTNNTSGCASGLYCVPMDYGSVCSPSPSGYAPTANAINPTYLQFYYGLIVTVINSYLVPVLMAVAFIVFLFGIYRAFIWNGAGESEKAEGRKLAMWGVIGFVIITSVWGLVNLVGSTIIPSSVQNTHPNYPTL